MATRRNYLQTNNKGPKQSANTFKPPTNNSIIVGYCRSDFQPLNPDLITKSTDKSLLAEHQQFYPYSQSLQLSTNDSGFIDDQMINNSLAIERKDEHINVDNKKWRHIAKQVSFLR
jgi:hypothetical protein